MDGIRLLHRATGGWQLVGDVALDADDMAAELAVLRRTAASLEPGGVRTKLLIPNEQIRYLTLGTGDVDTAERLEAARDALQGATPYEVDDLVFDVCADGTETHVAAVARETLAEAEAFALDHRFHPVCFAAVPGDQRFLGEPSFGLTETGPALLEPGEEVEPDDIAVPVIGGQAALPKRDSSEAADASDEREEDTQGADLSAEETPNQDDPIIAEPSGDPEEDPISDTSVTTEEAPPAGEPAQGTSLPAGREAPESSAVTEVSQEDQLEDAAPRYLSDLGKDTDPKGAENETPHSADTGSDADDAAPWVPVADPATPPEADEPEQHAHEAETPGLRPATPEPEDDATGPTPVDASAASARPAPTTPAPGVPVDPEREDDTPAPDTAASRHEAAAQADEAPQMEAVPAQSPETSETDQSKETTAPAPAVTPERSWAPAVPPKPAVDSESDAADSATATPKKGAPVIIRTAPVNTPAAAMQPASAAPPLPDPHKVRAGDAAMGADTKAASAPGIPKRTAPSLPPTPGFSSRRGPDSGNSSGGRREPKVGAAALAATTGISPALAAARDATGDRTAAIEPDSSSLSAPPPTGRSGRGGGGLLSRRKANAAQAAAMAPAGAAPVSEADRLTIFGARRSTVGGKPRFLGLILTAVLLIFLAGVAAWAAVFLDDGLNLSRLFGSREPEIALVTPTPEPDTALPQSGSGEVESVAIAPEQPVIPPTAPAAPGQPDADTPLTAPEPDAPAEIAVSDPGPAEGDATPPAEPLAQVAQEDTPPTREQLEARYATTGIWPVAPVVPPDPAGIINLDDFYLTSIDPVSTSADAVALPPAEALAPDAVPAAVPSPAAAGTQFAIGSDGLVTPSPDGAMNPDGVLIYAGRPPAVPAALPDRTATTPEAQAEEQAINTALAAFRPQLRPGDLVETTERAQLDGLTRSELASFRPELRPRSVQEAARADAVTPQDTNQAVAAALSAPEAPTAPVAAPEPAPAAPAFENATILAAGQSPRPDARPENFARIVQRAIKVKPQRQQTTPAAAATVAPRVVQPSIPSNTSVARSATVPNAINLRRVNLIGVYGKPSNRRALVRLGNGRYQKVVVGDRIEGGRVSAIGDNELRYTKNGRNVILQMP